jgi:hypothetical protein
MNHDTSKWQFVTSILEALHRGIIVRYSLLTCRSLHFYNCGPTAPCCSCREFNVHCSFTLDLLWGPHCSFHHIAHWLSCSWLPDSTHLLSVYATCPFYISFCFSWLIGKFLFLSIFLECSGSWNGIMGLCQSPAGSRVTLCWHIV